MKLHSMRRSVRESSTRFSSAPAPKSLSAATTLARCDAPLALFPADREGGAGRRRGDLAPPDCARRARAAARGWTVDVAAGGVARAPQGRADRARGARRDRGRGDADARPPAGGALEAHRALRHRRGLQARGSPGGRARARDDARGEPHVPRGPGGPLVSRPAQAALPLPDEGARRTAPTSRGAAYARVHHEGLLLV